MKREVTVEILVERCDAEEAAAGRKAAELRESPDKFMFTPLFDSAAWFWVELGTALALGHPLSRKQEFVATFLRKDMCGDHNVWNIDKHSRKRVTA